MRRTLAVLLLAGCKAAAPASDPASAAGADSAFAAVQARGATVMGVSQTASTHVFEDLPDGGRIVYTANAANDTAAVHAIQAHLRDIAGAFAKGDFSQPAQVHGREVPGTAALAARNATVRYLVADRPDGGELRIVTNDAATLAAVRDFLQFQRTDHRAPAHEGHSAAMDHAAHMRSAERPGGKAP
jgi:hypothetical protein